MKKSLLLCALVGAFFVGQAAHADTYSLSFGGCIGGLVGSCFFGTPVTNGTSSPGVSDVLFTINGTATPGFPVADAYQITGINGTVNIGSDTYTIGSLATGLGGDNLLIDSILGLSLDGKGIDFLLTGSGTPDYTELNVTFNSIQGEYTYTTEHCTGRGQNRTCTEETATGTNAGFAITDVDPAPAATPEPGSLALLGTSILAGAGVLRRRLRA
jgi:hypothetical protein